MRLFYLSIYYASYLIFPFFILMGYLFFKKKKFKERLAAIVLMILSVFFIYARFVEPKLLRIKYEKMPIQNLSGIKIAVFSDLHLGQYHHGVPLKKVVEKINGLDVDAVFIPGDFLFYMDKEDIENELRELGNFQFPAYAVTGNHDERRRNEPIKHLVSGVLEKYGIIVLDNEIRKIKIKGKDITLIGLGDLLGSATDFNLLAKAKGYGDSTIVLAHNPDSVYYFPEGARADLVISGHTHGGQIRLPFIYKYAIPTRYSFDQGFYDINGIRLYVTPGIGMTGFPLRFRVPPEIDVIEF